MTGPRFTRLTRNSESPALFENFLIAAVCSFLGIRSFLAVAHYPQIGGAGLHIAHMLWGGLFMLVALLLLLGYLDDRVHHAAAVLAGLGFGTFIDEIGKFVTADNNYFFRPAIALVYVAFVGAFLLARSFVGGGRLDARESLANVLDRLEGAFDRPIEPEDRAVIEDLLRRSDARSPLTSLLRTYVSALPGREDTDSPIEAVSRRLTVAYGRLLARRWFERGLTLGVVVYTGLAVGSVMTIAIAGMAAPNPDGPSIAALGQGLSTLVGGAFVFIGVAKLRGSRLAAYRWFMRGLLVWILLTQVFVFYSSQLAGLGGLAIDLVAYGSLRFALRREITTASGPIPSGDQAANQAPNQ